MNAKFKVYFGETPTDKVPALVVEWGRANGIASFEIFVQYLDEEAPTEPTLTLSSNGAAAYFDKLNGEVIDPSRSYVVYVVAKNRKGEEVGRTVTAFVAGPDNPDYTNPATITVTSGNSIALEKGQSFNIQAVVTLEDGTKGQIPGEYVPEFRYASNKEKVATVSASGEIVAVGRGTCVIQVFAKNALVAEIKVAVR